MKKLILFVTFGLVLSSAAMAQNVKIGYIHSQELLSLMPEMTKADKDLQAFAQPYKTQLETMAKELDTKFAAYQSGVNTMDAAMREVKEKEIKDLQARIESTQASAEQKVAAKKEELYKPILEKADKAIKAVAVEKGYDYVLDTSLGGVLYAKDSDNILAAVKLKLGIK